MTVTAGLQNSTLQKERKQKVHPSFPLFFYANVCQAFLLMKSKMTSRTSRLQKLPSCSALST